MVSLVTSLCAARIGNEHPDHAVLSGGDEELTVAAAADVQIRPRQFRAHGPIDELLKRHIRPSAIGADVELDLLDRRDRLWNPVVGLLHRGEVGCEETPALDVAEHELAAERGDATVIREPVGHRGTLVVVVDRNRIGEAVLLTPVEYLR